MNAAGNKHKSTVGELTWIYSELANPTEYKADFNDITQGDSRCMVGRDTPHRRRPRVPMWQVTRGAKIDFRNRPLSVARRQEATPPPPGAATRNAFLQTALRRPLSPIKHAGGAG